MRQQLISLLLLITILAIGNSFSIRPLFHQIHPRNKNISPSLSSSKNVVSTNYFIATTTNPPSRIIITVCRNSLDDDDDDAEQAAETLPLSDSDIQRLSQLRSRIKTIPIMVLDAMLPGQCLQFGSSDPKFRKLIEYALRDDYGEIGMIGFNPHTGRPLNMGVTLPITSSNITTSTSTNEVTISVQAQQRFEVQNEPWMDDSDSFYMAHIEIVEDREEEPLSDDEMRDVEQMFDMIPNLVRKWNHWVIVSGRTNVDGLEMRMKDIGPMPNSIRERAVWVAAMINPLPALGVCLEIRPAMLACTNDYDRMKLATTAIQSSIDHLSGKRRLF